MQGSCWGLGVEAAGPQCRSWAQKPGDAAAEAAAAAVTGRLLPRRRNSRDGGVWVLGTAGHRGAIGHCCRGVVGWRVGTDGLGRGEASGQLRAERRAAGASCRHACTGCQLVQPAASDALAQVAGAGRATCTPADPCSPTATSPAAAPSATKKAASPQQPSRRGRSTLPSPAHMPRNRPGGPEPRLHGSFCRRGRGEHSGPAGPADESVDTRCVRRARIGMPSKQHPGCDPTRAASSLAQLRCPAHRGSGDFTQSN